MPEGIGKALGQISTPGDLGPDFRGLRKSSRQDQTVTHSSGYARLVRITGVKVSQVYQTFLSNYFLTF